METTTVCIRIRRTFRIPEHVNERLLEKHWTTKEVAQKIRELIRECIENQLLSEVELKKTYPGASTYKELLLDKELEDALHQHFGSKMRSARAIAAIVVAYSKTL
ncbi:MAG: hypothetical protein ACRC6X_08245 [Culicoidibacterales bacterium]